MRLKISKLTKGYQKSIVIFGFTFLICNNYVHSNNGIVDTTLFNSMSISTELEEYYKFFNNGRKSLSKKDYDSASYFFYEAFLTKKAFATHLQLFIITEIYFKNKANTDKLNNYVEVYYSKYADVENSNFLYDSIYYSKIPRKTKEFIEENKSLWRTTYLSNLNFTLINALIRITTLDQYTRDLQLSDFLLHDSLAATVQDISIYKSYKSNLMKYSDRKAEIFLLEHFKKFGVPTEEELGVNYGLFHLLLRHCFSRFSDYEEAKYYIGALFEAVLNGKLASDIFASAIDYRFKKDPDSGEVYKIYGLVYSFHEQYNESTQFIDYYNIDKKRRNIGLLPLYEEAQISNQTLNLPVQYLTIYYDSNTK